MQIQLFLQEFENPKRYFLGYSEDDECIYGDCFHCLAADAAIAGALVGEDGRAMQHFDNVDTSSPILYCAACLPQVKHELLERCPHCSSGHVRRSGRMVVDIVEQLEDGDTVDYDIGDWHDYVGTVTCRCFDCEATWHIEIG